MHFFNLGHLLAAMNKGKGKRKWRNIKEKLFKFFTFSIYIRIFLQSFIIILLSWLNEIYELKLNNSVKLVSFSMNIIILFAILFIFELWIKQIIKAHPILDENKQYYFTEFFSGLKNKTSSRMLPLVYMGQRILSCFLVIFAANINSVVKMSILTFIQTSHLVFLLVVRPYELVKDLILETMSQLIMVFFWGMLIHFNSEDKWNSTINWIFIGTLMWSSLISTLIAFIDLITI